MPALVIDASIKAAWCFPDERTEYTNAVLHTISTPIEAGAPRLWAYEVRNAVLMGLRRKRITQADAREFHAAVDALPIRLVDPVLYDAIFGLANVSALPYMMPRISTWPSARACPLQVWITPFAQRL